MKALPSEIRRLPIRIHLLIACLLGLIIGSIYFPLGYADFIDFDDPSYVSNNPQVQEGLTLAGVKWALTTGEVANWHPLTWMSHMLDVEIFGVAPGWHHMVNVMFHIANTILLYWLCHRTTGSTWRSAFVAAIFGLHPMHVESVAWIAERKDVLSTLFFLLTIWAYASYTSAKAGGFRRKTILFYLLSLMLFALGLMSKPMLVTLPFVLLLLDLWPLKRIEWQTKAMFRLVLEKIPFFLLSLAASIATFLVQHDAGATEMNTVVSLGNRLLNALVAYGRYTGKWFWPAKLSIFYPYPSQWPTWIIVLSALLLVSVSLLALLQIRKRPYIFVGWCWFLGTLVPVIGIVQVGSQSMADRYSYIPSIGLMLALTWTVYDLLGKGAAGKLILRVVAIIAIAASTVETSRVISYWQSGERLFVRATETTDGNAITYTILGLVLSDTQPDKAIECYQRALQSNPNYIAAINNLGQALAKKGQTDAAMALYNRALELEPKNAYDSANNLAAIYTGMGRYEEAVTLYEQALRIRPEFPGALVNFAILRAACPEDRFRNGQEAIRMAEKACKFSNFRNPNFVGTLGVAYAEIGSFDKAIEYAELARRLADKAGLQQRDVSKLNTELIEKYRKRIPYRLPVASTE